MKVVVAGGTGFIGRHIVGELLAAGHDVDVLTRDPARVTAIPGLGDARGLRGDVLDPESLRGTLDGADTVVTALAFPNYPMEQPRKGRTFHRYEVGATRDLLAEARGAGVRRFLYVSGAGASPTSPWSWYRAKGLAEQAIGRSGIDHCLLRPSWAYGPGDKALNKFVAISRISPVVPMPAPVGRPQRVQPVYVGDIAVAVRRILETEAAWNKTLEIGSRAVWTMRDVVAAVCRTLGKRRVIVPVPAPLVKLATAPLLLLPSPPLSPGAVDFATQDGLVDASELEMLLGLQPLELTEGLARYLAA
ncbi:MAG: NAD(P)H-binding protein [Actinomycetota bacterium]